jgi:alanyl-tRNA synthetase
LDKESSVTERLYYQDPYLRTFHAQVVQKREVNAHPAVVLDATAFYPTGGGQPHDTGTLNGVRVVDVQVLQEGEIAHLLDGPLNVRFVQGEIDWARRFDHMQQHTGQHILSQAFLQTLNAETVGFHLGEALSTIDLDRAPLSHEQVAAAVQVANSVVLDNRPVIARFVDKGELATMPLRKMPDVEGPIRIVQVSEFDWSPCGGTHVRNSGEVGAIHVGRIERRKKQTRIHFLCGWRALVDYDRKHEIVQALTAHFTTGEEEIIPSVERLEAEVKRARKKLVATQMQLLDYELTEWIDQAESVGQVQVVRLAFDDWDVDMLKEAARRLTERPGIVALLAIRGPSAQLVFARSDDVAADMGELMRAACAATGGRGGGRPQFAQGSAPGNSLVDLALDEAVGHLKEL